MNIRFCEFCSNVLQDASTHCPICGTRLIGESAGEQSGDPENLRPFVSVDTFCLQIQGQPRYIRFSGTHSVYHLWSRLHSAYEAMRLYCRPRKDEMELLAFPAEDCPADFQLLEPGILLNCKYRKFSFHTYEETDPDVALEPGETEKVYYGNFEITDCPGKEWGHVLGWLVATAPRPAEQWTYEM